MNASRNRRLTPVSRGWSEKLTGLLRGLLLVFFFECAVGSSGRWLEVGPTSVRILLFILIFVLSLPLLWLNRRFLLRQPVNWVLAVFFAWVALAVWRGFQAGYRLGFIRNDLTAFLTLLLIPAVMVVYASREHLRTAIWVIFAGSTCLALLTVLIHWTIPLGLYDLNALNDLINRTSLGGMTSGTLAVIRIYFKSQVMHLPAILIGLTRMGEARTIGRRILFSLMTALNALSLILSFTRSFWIGFAAAALVYVLVCPRRRQHIFKPLLLVLAGFAALLLVTLAVYRQPVVIPSTIARLNPNLIAVLPRVQQPELRAPQGPVDAELSENDLEALNIRIDSLNEHQRLIREQPLLGTGLGRNLDGVRRDGRTEYLYWDMLMKLGVPGFLLFLAVYLWQPLDHLRRLLRQDSVRRRSGNGRRTWSKAAAADGLLPERALISGYLGMAVASYFNPYLTTPLSISVLLLIVASNRLLRTHRDR